MATKLYLHAATSPDDANLPHSEQSSALPVGTLADRWSTNPVQVMDTTIGVSQTNFEATTLAQSTHQDITMPRFATATLAAQTISANTWTVAHAFAENNTNANAFIVGSLYVWRPPSTVVGYVYDSDTALGTEWPLTTVAGQVISISGSAVTAASGDMLVWEVWAHEVQAMSTAYLIDLWYDGTVDVTAGGSGTASYISTPQDITFGSAVTPAPVHPFAPVPFIPRGRSF